MVSIGIVPKVRFLWDCLWPGTSANIFFNFQDFLWNDWFFFLFFFSVHKYVHPWWMVVICSFPLIQFSFHYIYFFSKRRIYVNSKSETTDVWCDVLVPSLCAICWHGVPYSKCIVGARRGTVTFCRCSPSKTDWWQEGSEEITWGHKDGPFPVLPWCLGR